jgi:nucleoside-diphosphate-sugar epimerase
LFIGGTGQISLSCVEAALAAGDQVTVFNRGATDAALPKGVDKIAGDYAEDEAFDAATRDGFDVVCQFIAFTADQVGRDLAMLQGRTGQYIFISSASAYKKPVDAFPITEDVPLENPYWEYSRRKAAAEAVIRAQDAVPWTIVRPSHTVRTQLPGALGERDRMADRLRLGLPMIVPGDGTSLWTLTRSEDIAAPFVRLFGRDAALGEAFHLTSDNVYTWDQITRAAADLLGVTTEIVHVPSETLVARNPEWEGPLLGDRAWSVMFDNSKIKSVVGDFACERDLHEVMRQPIAHYRRRAGDAAPRRNDLDRLFDAIIADQRKVATG